MSLIRLGTGITLLGGLLLLAAPASFGLVVVDDKSITGVQTGSGSSVTGALDGVFGVNSYSCSITHDVTPDNTSGVNYPPYVSTGLQFAPTVTNYLYRAQFTYVIPKGSLLADGGYAIIVHENAGKTNKEGHTGGNGFYYISDNTTVSTFVKTAGTSDAYSVTAVADPPGSGLTSQFQGITGADDPPFSGDRECVVFYGLSTVQTIVIVGPGSHAPFVQEWNSGTEAPAGTHKPTTYIDPGSLTDTIYNYQE